jgi:Tol biopolymer transport system component/serine/threonine protein kinase
MTHLQDRLQIALGPGYEVERELGGGGMSHTYVALEKALGRRIVAKVLPSGMGAHVSVERFRREIQVAARLAHPHIVPLLSVGEVDDLPFYTMPFVKGESLRLRLAREGQLSFSDTARVLRDVAAALMHAHAEGVVHRDIKPDNVILSGGVAVVTDFGVAKARDVAATPDTDEVESPWVTSLGLTLGTLAYMSPEQATGAPDLDHRSDLYSFGCMAYELICGEVPFRPENPQQVLSAHVHEKPVPVEQRREGVPPALARLVMRCLAKNPADRPQGADEILSALDEITTPTGAVPALRLTPRRRWPWAIAALAFAATLFVVARQWPPRPFTLGSTSQLSAEPELELDAAISPDGRLVAYSAGIFGRMRIYVRQADGSGRVALSADLPGTHRWPAWSPDGQRLAFMGPDGIYIVAALGGAADRAVTEPGHALLTPSWSPDGEALVYADDRGIWTRALAGGEPQMLVAARAAHSPVFSPDGKWIAFVDENATYIGDVGNIAPSAIAVVAANGGEPRQLTTATRMHASPRWSPDGRSILFVSDIGGVRDIYQLALSRSIEPIGEPTRLTTGINAYSLSLTGDASRLAYSTLSLRSNVWVAPVSATATTAASEARQLTTGGQVIEAMDISADGAWLLYDSNRLGNQDIFKQSLSGGEPVALTREAADDFGPAFSEDGREIAFYSVRNGTRDLFVMDADGRNLRQVTDGPSQDYFPDWSPDGTTLVYTGTAPDAAREVFTTARDANGVWQAPVRRTFNRTRTAAYQRWSPDGRWLAWAENEGVALLDVSAADSTPRIIGGRDEGLVRSVAWGRDTREVFYLTASPSSPNEIRAIAVSGGNSRLVLRLDGDGWVQRIQRFATDGRRLFFSLADDEADVWVMELLR